MNKIYYEAASLLHSALRAQTTCYENGRIIKADQIVAIDDDPTSALWAVRLYYEVRMAYGYCPTILCVGGKGLMSKHTHKKSEAMLLADVVRQLGVPANRIKILGEGRNSGDNVLAVAKATDENVVTIWCVTQRLSLRLERTQAKQAPEVKSYYFVIEQSIDEVMRLYNGKGLCDGQMLLHELASILNRCEAYAGTFQQPLDFEVDEEVRDAARLLEKNFRLKLPKKNLRSLFQVVRLYFCILTNKGKMRKELDEVVKDFASTLVEDRLVGAGDTILGRWLPTEIIGRTPVSWNGCYGLSAHYEGGDPIYAKPIYPYGII